MFSTFTLILTILRNPTTRATRALANAVTTIAKNPLVIEEIFNNQDFQELVNIFI